MFNPEGQLIGRFRLDRLVSNVAFGSDGRVYFTATDLVVRVRVPTRPSKLLGAK